MERRREIVRVRASQSFRVGSRRRRGFGVAVAALGAMFVALGVGVSSANAAITATSGAVVMVSPPPSVLENAYESNTEIRAFDERQAVTLASAVKVDITTAGTFDIGVSSLTPGSIPAGTVVDSHFLHADPVGSPPPSAPVKYDGSVTFDGQILGIIVLKASLDATDAMLGAPGTLYPTNATGPRGLEKDDVVTSDNLHTVTVHLVMNEFDQIRVITQSTSSTTTTQSSTTIPSTTTTTLPSTTTTTLPSTTTTTLPSTTTTTLPSTTTTSSTTTTVPEQSSTTLPSTTTTSSTTSSTTTTVPEQSSTTLPSTTTTTFKTEGTTLPSSTTATTVKTEGSTTPITQPSPTTVVASGGGSLPFTGSSDTAALLVSGLAMLGTGLAIALSDKRRNTT